MSRWEGRWTTEEREALAPRVQRPVHELGATLSEAAEVISSATTIEGADSVNVATIGTSMRMSRDAGSQFVSLRLFDLDAFDEFENMFPPVKQVEELMIVVPAWGKNKGAIPRAAARTDVVFELYDDNYRTWIRIWAGISKDGRLEFDEFVQQFAPIDVSAIRISSSPWRHTTFSGWADVTFHLRSAKRA